MPLRLARYSDLPSASQLLAQAFYNEQLNQHIFPYRQHYQEDYVRAWRWKILQKWWSWDCICVVSYAEACEQETAAAASLDDKQQRDGDSDSSDLRTCQLEHSDSAPHNKQIFKGISVWSLTDTTYRSPWRISRWDPRRIISPLLSIYHRFLNSIFHNRATRSPSPTDPTPLHKLNFDSLLGPFADQFFVEPAYRRRHWELSLLGVHPQFQGLGVGSELVRWGLEKAEADGLPAVVVGAPDTESFYQRRGFTELVGYISQAVDGEGEGRKNPLMERGIGGGAVMWTR
jgi:GNAT superfamily N-acetyltransferase